MPVIRLDIQDDDEFTSCEYCKRHVQPYNNTSLSTTPIHNLYTKTLLSYHYLNCQKCGLYIELHPKNSTDEGLIFLCPNHIPHKHCLCYDCGLLYNLKTHKKPNHILSQLQYNNTTQSTHTQIQSQPTNNNLLASNFPSSMGIVSNGTFIAELMNEMASNAATAAETAATNTTANDDTNSVNSGGLPLFIGTIMALFVWFGIYLTSPELFRLSGCIVWFSIFYFLTNVFFTENELVQRAVFSLFGFSPIFAAVYIFDKTRKLQNNELLPDLQMAIQFFCIFGCIVYLSYYFSPLQMYLFLKNDFMELTIAQQIISLFIAVSLGSFVLMLCKNCNILTRLFNSNQANTQKYLELELNESDNAKLMADLQITNETNESTEINLMKKKRKRRKRKKKRVD